MTKRTFTHEELINYAAGEIAPALAAEIEIHLAENPAAAQTVAAFRLARTRIAEDDSVAPPESVAAKARAIYEAPAKRAQETPAWLLRIDAFIARLVFDSRLETVAVRYSQPTQGFQLAFSIDGADLDLTAERTAGSPDRPWRLTGQLSSEPSIGEMELAIVEAGTDRIVAEGRSDEHGYFTVDLPAGRYDLCLDMGDSTLVAPELEMP